MRGRVLQLAILALVAAISADASADVVMMQNGDRISGEVNRIWGNDLTIEPDYSDEFIVDLDKVAYIESDREFDLTLEDGREVTAQLLGAGAGGRQPRGHQREQLVEPRRHPHRARDGVFE